MRNRDAPENRDGGGTNRRPWEKERENDKEKRDYSNPTVTCACPCFRSCFFFFFVPHSPCLLLPYRQGSGTWSDLLRRGNGFLPAFVPHCDFSIYLLREYYYVFVPLSRPFSQRIFDSITGIRLEILGAGNQSQTGMFPLSNASFTSLSISLFLSMGLFQRYEHGSFFPLRNKKKTVSVVLFSFFLFYLILCPFLSPQAETNQPCRLPLYLVIVISEERYLACRHSRRLVARRSIELKHPSSSTCPDSLDPSTFPPRAVVHLASCPHGAFQSQSDQEQPAAATSTEDNGQVLGWDQRRQAANGVIGNTYLASNLLHPRKQEQEATPAAGAPHLPSSPRSPPVPRSAPTLPLPICCV
ncbi:hypothetical protein CABS01_12540 [Colletotrichum abscissum]|uniref:uncharacterized protein n=1 Tax=Colletotrichum abscissum TaxID=1671311 RepID=UPI0027D73D2B|nr:uncharacterized protein CABS01_12540 [Colletotrichum abscissum]KAK1489959.1 hypothetical protein CABS01_12540 [Colletotrichum abscissum]